MTTTSAQKILDLLAGKHAGDVFVPECKDGPTHSAAHQRMDAWVMKKSWAHPLCIAYEIKVSRGDFVNDNKWRGYLGYCNEFYFVCPSRLIVVDELPTEIGLLWVTRTGGRLLTKRKAVYRDVQIPDSVFRYILMCRAGIGEAPQMQTPAERWRDWLAEKGENQELGWRVSKRIRELVQERITNARSQNRRLEGQQKKYAEIAAVCDELGITVGALWDVRGTVKRKIAEANGAQLARQIGELVSGLDRLKTQLSGAE